MVIASPPVLVGVPLGVLALAGVVKARRPRRPAARSAGTPSQALGTGAWAQAPVAATAIERYGQVVGQYVGSPGVDRPCVLRVGQASLELEVGPPTAGAKRQFFYLVYSRIEIGRVIEDDLTRVIVTLDLRGAHLARDHRNFVIDFTGPSGREFANRVIMIALGRGATLFRPMAPRQQSANSIGVES